MKITQIYHGLLFWLAFVLPLRAEKFNVVFILADDLGWTDLGCHGSTYYETPHIDRLAAEGVRFRNHHHCPNCQPTRAALMSGQYGARTGVYTVGGIDRFDWSMRPLRPVDNVQVLPLDRYTVAQALKASGYRTAMFGKWHLGERAGHHPSARGFDEAIVSMGKHVDFETNPKISVRKGEYLADFLTDRAVEFIRKNRDEPFFLYLPHFGVHAPFEAKDAWTAHFKAKEGTNGHKNPVYAAMIASVDESVGRIVKELETLGIEGKTVVIFSSDNGGVGGYERPGGLIVDRGNTPDRTALSVTDNDPLRSGKGSLYEGGIRVPFIARWPGVAPREAVCDEPSIHVDLYPTLLEITGSAAPAGYPLDGKSLVPLMRDPTGHLDRDAIYQHFPGYLGSGPGKWRTTPVGVIQSGSWKLMEYFESNSLELYNLSEDLGETRNRARENPDVASELHGKLVAWRKAVNAPMPKSREAVAGDGADKPVKAPPKRVKKAGQPADE